MKPYLIYIIFFIFAFQLKVFAIPEEVEATCSAGFIVFIDSANAKPNTAIFTNISKIHALLPDEDIKFEWDFGDGKRSFGVNAVHTYLKADFYYICLKVRVVKRSDTNNIVCESNYCKNNVLIGKLKAFNIGGQVFAGKYPVKSGRADLFRVRPDHSLIPTRSMHFDTLGYFYFYKVVEGNFIVKITPDDPTFFPTYYGNAALWKDASNLKIDKNTYTANINLIPVKDNKGTAQISGHLNFDLTHPLDLKNIIIVLTDIDSNPITYTRTDNRANYYFNDIAFGTYKIYADEIGWINNEKTVSVDASTPVSSSNLELAWNIYSSVSDVNDNSAFDISNPYPNPVSDILNINITSKKTVTSLYSFEIFNIQGVLILKSQYSILNTSDKISFDLNALGKGIYFIRISNKEMTIPVVKKFIKY